MNKEEIGKKIEELKSKNESLIKEFNKAMTREFNKAAGLNAKPDIEIEALKKRKGGE